MAKKKTKKSSAAKKKVVARARPAKKVTAKKAVAKKAAAKKAAAKKTPAKKAAARVAPQAAKKKKVTRPTARVGEDVLNKRRAEVFERQLEENPPERQDGGKAFVKDDGTSSDEFSGELARDFLQAAETAEDNLEEHSDEVEDEENGGPFVESSGDKEFAEGTDESNPEGSEVEPFPTVNRKH